jgi:AcrR family transcriptional regulator
MERCSTLCQDGTVPPAVPRSPRRTDPLSTERLVSVAIEILDEDGEDALTFRLLAARLSTGPGAIYHHVSSKDELLRAATTDAVSAALDDARLPRDPLAAIRALALAVFDAIDAHPWIGAQLAREPWQFAVIRVFEAVGQRLEELGVPEDKRFGAASALTNSMLGLAGQYAAGVRHLGRDGDRAAFLHSVAHEWEQLDREAFPFLRSIAGGLAAHDDRDQFLAGIDLIIAGIQAIR